MSDKNERLKAADVVLNDVGKFLLYLYHPASGEPVATVRQLPGKFLAVDIVGDETLALVLQLLPQTRLARATDADGTRRYRLVYNMPEAAL